VTEPHIQAAAAGYVGSAVTFALLQLVVLS
jgi:hypothetical protein